MFWKLLHLISFSYLQQVDSEDETDSDSEHEEKSDKTSEAAEYEEKMKTLSISCYLNRWCIISVVTNTFDQRYECFEVKIWQWRTEVTFPFQSGL